MRQLLGQRASEYRAAQGLEMVRITVAVLVFIHGAARLVAGGVAPFGVWLDGIGFPAGLLLASAVTGYELLAPISILLRRYVTIACLGYIFILILGLVLVHLPAGWFVVGLGRNGMEYSVLLIVSLASVAWAYRPATET
jgi:putative oxidoreductase